MYPRAHTDKSSAFGLEIFYKHKWLILRDFAELVIDKDVLTEQRVRDPSVPSAPLRLLSFALSVCRSLARFSTPNDRSKEVCDH